MPLDHEQVEAELERFDYRKWYKDVAESSPSKAGKLLGVTKAAVLHWNRGANITRSRRIQMIAVAQKEMRRLAELYRRRRDYWAGPVEDLTKETGGGR